MAQKPWTQSKTPVMKPVFAAYLNMARHNLFRTLLHISRQVQLPEEIRDDSKAANMALWKELGSGNPTDQLKISGLLQKDFPFLQAFLDVEKKKEDIQNAISPKKVRDLFVDIIIPSLNRLRNEYSHFRPDSRKTDKEEKLVPYLYRVLDGAAREARNRFSLTVNSPIENQKEGKTILAINQSVEEVFQGSFRKQKVAKTDRNGKPMKDRRGKPMMEFKDRDNYYYALSSSGHSLSDIGIIFFTCLFLEKKYISLFLDALKPWPKDFDADKRKAVLEVFSVYHIRLPKEKYDSSRPDYALGLDMLNELQRCPKELFDTLMVTRRDSLSVTIKEEDIEDDGVTVKDGKVMMIRVRDRFPQMALSYIDLQKIFKDIRFMVRLGTYRFKFYPKKCIGNKGKESLRVLQKEINGFGRINEIETERIKRYSGLFKPIVKTTNEDGTETEERLPDSVDSRPYISNSKSRYLIDNNRIGLRINEQMFLPALRSGDGPLTRASDIKLKSPHAWLSVYELPGLIFYIELCRKYPQFVKEDETAEAIIKSYVEAYSRLFSDIRNNQLDPKDCREYLPGKYYPLTLGDLPVKIKNHILDPETRANPLFTVKSRNLIVKMLESSERDLERFKANLSKMGTKDNKLNKKGYVDIKAGKVAELLARDILYFTPPSEAKSRITSANFNSLQAALAIGQLSMARFKEIVKPLSHPFIFNAINRFKQSEFRIFDFYQAYLQSKITYLRSKRNLGKAELEELPFLHAGRIKWRRRNKQYIQDLAGRYLDEDLGHGFELPRGVFTERAESLMKRAGIPLPQSKEGRKLGMANLINAYFKEVLQDNNQPFYRWERHYRIFDKLAGQTNGNSLVHQFLMPNQLEKKMRLRKQLKPSSYMIGKAGGDVKLAEETLKRDYAAYDDNEKKLRRFETEDKVMYLMAKNILFDISGVEEETLNKFKLRDILPGKEDSILELQVPFRVELRIDNVSLVIKQKEWVKIKRYGEFFYYNSDTRLRSLIKHLVKDAADGHITIEVDRELLDKELEGYDRQRVAIMRMVQSLERSILSQAQSPVSAAMRQNFNSLISEVGKIPYEKRGKTLISIRNSFCHNEYARGIEISDGMDLPQVAERISKLFETAGGNKNPES